ncbi:MAG: transporter [Stagnimonas sp.]|nr:transporter [Stagnimonas sp.]
MPRLHTLIVGLVLALALQPARAQAGLIFTPHLSEYAVQANGTYTETTFIFSEIEKVFDREGNTVRVGVPFVPAGASTDVGLALFKVLWVGNVFRDTGIPYLRDHSQFCRLISGFGYQQNTEQIADRGRLFGARPGSNGLLDLYGLCGIYSSEYRLGPVKFNGLFATTFKEPLGEYDTDAMLNIGTNYRSVIPQLAFHGELFGRLFVDATVAYQFNGDNSHPSFGGTTPTRIADWWNAEANFAWKFSEHWFADIGYSFHKSVGHNGYDQVTVNFKDQPLAPDTLCAALGLGSDVCNTPALDAFYLAPRSGPYEDRGVQATLLSAGISYVYRSSSVLQFRIAKPISGRGSQIDVIYDVCGVSDCPGADRNNNGTGDNSISQLSTTLFGVQEAAAASASPYAELRFVYLFWAP